MDVNKRDAALVELQRAVTPEEFWPAAERLIRTVLPVNHVLLGLKGSGTLPAFLRTSQPVPDQPEYFRNLNAVAPLAERVRQNPGVRVSRMSDHVPTVLLLVSPFYRKFMKPEGWRYAAALLFWDRDKEFLGQLALNRTRSQGDITDEEMVLLEAVYPHVQAAIERLLASDRLNATGPGLEQAIAGLPVPTLLVDWSLRIRYANTAGKAALGEWRSDTEETAGPAVPKNLPPELRALCGELRASWESVSPSGRAAAPKLAASVAHPTVADFSTSVRLVEPHSGRTIEPCFVVQFSLPPEHHESRGRALAELAKLTAAEQTIARLAAGGYDNAAVAEKLGISPNTVKTHLRHIFEKLRITSRSQLVALQDALARVTTSSLVVLAGVGW